MRNDWVTLKMLLVVMYLLALCDGTFAQEINVRSGFLLDSARIGDEIPYYLTATYPAKLTLLFPDSSYTYTTFEYLRKQYVPTVTTNGVSYDSVVYYISTFEIDSLQALKLPVFIVSSADCTLFYSSPDTILLNQLISTIPDSMDARTLPLRMNVAYEPVSQTFNYPIAAGIVLLVVALGVAAWFLFGGKIRRHWRIKRLQKKYDQFMQEYTVGMQRIKSELSPLTAEAVILIWKRYLEELEKVPFTKLTTRETVKILKEPLLEQHLRAIDRLLYGNAVTTVEPFEQLRSVANREFQKKLEDLKNG